MHVTMYYTFLGLKPLVDFRIEFSALNSRKDTCQIIFIYLFIHCFERVAQLASKLFYLGALISNIITYREIKQHHHHIE